ncbi:hypothetical protein U1Q18_052566 [Sarracenia purpurea var. burkii]
MHSVPTPLHSVPGNSHSVPVNRYSVPHHTHSVPVTSHSVPQNTHSVPATIQSLQSSPTPLHSVLPSPSPSIPIYGITIDLPLPPPSIPASLNSHPMMTRSKTSSLPCSYSTVTHFSSSTSALPSTEPRSVVEALKSPEWLSAMNDEFLALQTQKTWSLVHPPPNANIVGCKWVFKIKRNADGSIARYKVRLVAKGYNQEQCIIILRLLVL